MPVALHRERVRDDVPSPTLVLHVPAAFHLGHRAHGSHVVLEGELGAIDRLSTRLADGDSQPVLADRGRIRINRDLNVEISGLHRGGLLFCATRSGDADEREGEKMRKLCFHGWCLSRIPDSAAFARPRSTPATRCSSARYRSYMTRWVARSSSCMSKSRSLSSTMRKLPLPDA